MIRIGGGLDVVANYQTGPGNATGALMASSARYSRRGPLGSVDLFGSLRYGRADAVCGGRRAGHVEIVAGQQGNAP